MLHPGGQIDRPLAGPGADREQPDQILTESAAEPRAGVERDRVAERIEADAPTVEHLGAELAEAEDAARFEKERPLLRKQDREPRQIRNLTVGLYLGEVGVRREIERHG